jgi:hypothetical protein
MTNEGRLDIMNHRLKLGLVLVSAGVMLFFWSIWLVSWTYDAFSTHCDTVDLWSKNGVAAIVLMLIGTILFSAGTFFIATSDSESDSEEVQRERTR